MKKIFVSGFLMGLIISGYCQSADRMAREYFYSGTEKVSKRNYPEAVKDLSEAIRLNPLFLQAYENRGVAKYHLDDFKGAYDDFSKALELNPNDYNTYGRRGWAEFYLKDYNGAIADFSKAIEGITKDDQYYNIRGESKYHISDFQGAIADFDKVILSVYSNKFQKRKAYYWRGMIKIDLGQKDMGCADLQEAKKMGLEEADLLIQVHCR